ncbi:hypothetical protein LUZ60_010757 [Juncus effusus]|nr:hypothetical protein LUZ60_010757 [Juncus effusus]
MSTLLIILILFAPLVSSTFIGTRTNLTRVGSDKQRNKTELIQHAIARDKRRHTNFYSSTRNITSPVQEETSMGEYLMTLSIGTPAITYPAIADTGSDLIWTQCQPCKSCFNQSTTIYDPSMSSTVNAVPCNSIEYLSLCNSNNLRPSCYCMYNYIYGSGWTSGKFDTEKFTFGHVEITNITFGCSTSSSIDFVGSSGLVGLGRGPLSLISQLGRPKFSYCLTSYFDITSTSPLFIGPIAALNGKNVKSISFVRNPKIVPYNTFYYLPLKGISIGIIDLLIPPSTFALNSDGSGGIIIDSGTTFTRLVEEAYIQVEKAIVLLVKDLPMAAGEFDLCYQLQAGMSPPSLPNMIFHFDGADMELTYDNYMIIDGNLWCLAMFGSSYTSIFGNYQQQNIHILYDVANNMLSFVPTQCNQL